MWASTKLLLDLNQKYETFYKRYFSTVQNMVLKTVVSDKENAVLVIVFQMNTILRKYCSLLYSYIWLVLLDIRSITSKFEFTLLSMFDSVLLHVSFSVALFDVLIVAFESYHNSTCVHHN